MPNITLDMPFLEQITPTLKILSHPLRLRILDFLDTSGSPQRVTEIIEHSDGAKQAIISQQLKILRDFDVLIATRKGNCVFYSIKNRDLLYFLDFIRNTKNNMD